MDAVSDTNGSPAEHRVQSGFTLVELLIVIVIIGILATVTVFAVRSITDRGEDASCLTDAKVLETAADVYFAQNATDDLPASGAGPNRFERGLVDVGVLRSASSLYDLDIDGTLTAVSNICI